MATPVPFNRLIAGPPRADGTTIYLHPETNQPAVYFGMGADGQPLYDSQPAPAGAAPRPGAATPPVTVPGATAYPPWELERAKQKWLQMMQEAAATGYLPPEMGAPGTIPTEERRQFDARLDAETKALEAQIAATEKQIAAADARQAALLQAQMQQLQAELAVRREIAGMDDATRNRIADLDAKVQRERMVEERQKWMTEMGVELSRRPYDWVANEYYLRSLQPPAAAGVGAGAPVPGAAPGVSLPEAAAPVPAGVAAAPAGGWTAQSLWDAGQAAGAYGGGPAYVEPTDPRAPVYRAADIPATLAGTSAVPGGMTVVLNPNAPRPGSPMLYREDRAYGGSPVTGVPDYYNAPIPAMAGGGVMPWEGPALVGEQGPEMVTLPAGADVKPLTANDVADLPYLRKTPYPNATLEGMPWLQWIKTGQMPPYFQQFTGPTDIKALGIEGPPWGKDVSYYFWQRLYPSEREMLRAAVEGQGRSFEDWAEAMRRAAPLGVTGPVASWG